MEAGTRSDLERISNGNQVAEAIHRYVLTHGKWRTYLDEYSPDRYIRRIGPGKQSRAVCRHKRHTA